MFWGLTPALDFQEEIRANGKHVDEINILIVGGQDCRHIIKTLAGRYKHEKVVINFYILEAVLETVAKQLLLLNIALQPKEELGLVQKARYFMELYGNTLVRPAVAKYLKLKASDLVEMITNESYLKDIMPFVDVQLKYKERDYLENVFKFWCSVDDFDICLSWDRRLRKSLGVRYDTRMGVFDWDLHMRLHHVGGIQVCSQEYKHWRATGVAFTWLESEVSKSNRSLVCCVISNGEKYGHYGYLGEMETGPYVAYGIDCEDLAFLKRQHGTNSHRSTDVTERNLRQYFYELENGEEYIHTKVNNLNLGASTFAVSENKVVDCGTAGDIVKTRKPCRCLNIDDVKVKFVTINALSSMKHKENFHNFFNLLYFGSTYLKYLDGAVVELIAAPDSVLIIENQMFVLTHRDKELEEFEKLIEEKVQSVEQKTSVPFNVKKDHYAKFVLKS
ncbi:hypothetical protein PPYR_11928 [Photinus pyralis]|uniref:Dynein assembly factor 3, axonemal homolog n=1 Tax=Photinus pyralis TaxID=7054 RepID=A0A5N4ACS8_PHOPY|nr:dynein assembly factor 3, axonemal homolog [Photinus pyralis]KAB0795089.1 hypothetical protein PPYR_11928 [Photinus pyralis]